MFLLEAWTRPEASWTAPKEQFSFYGARVCGEHYPQPLEIRKPLMQGNCCGWSFGQPRCNSTGELLAPKACAVEGLRLSWAQLQLGFRA